MRAGNHRIAVLFESLLLRRVVQAVEAGEVPADRLAELQAEFEASQAKPQEESHAEAVRDMAERLAMPVLEAEQALAAIESQPTMIRELLMRRIAEKWLETQREAYEGRSSQTAQNRLKPHD